MSGHCKKCGYDGCVCDETDTPETDKTWDDLCDSWASWSVNYAHEALLDHARKLERERDEARREAEKYRNYFSNTTIERYAATKAGQFNLPWEKPDAETA